MKILIPLVLILLNTAFAQPSAKRIAVTIDDLPLNIAQSVHNTELRRVVERLLKQITAAGVPATAFVNENKLEMNGVRDPERVAVLKLWLDAGVDLGNHTYAHKSQNRIPIAEAQEDIVKGERTIKELLRARGKHPEYFRHPYLQTGRDSLTRATLTAFLDSLGYTIAPVTIDNGEWIYSSANDKAFIRNDTAQMRTIGTAYLSYMRKKTEFFEWLSDTLFGRQIHQILLIHSNRLNADYYAALCRQYAADGYTFCTVKEALQDEAYRSRDTFYGGGGISWLDRWALTRGYKGTFFAAEPQVPKEIMDLAGVESE